jgi:hypothetical protein
VRLEPVKADWAMIIDLSDVNAEESNPCLPVSRSHTMRTELDRGRCDVHWGRSLVFSLGAECAVILV